MRRLFHLGIILFAASVFAATAHSVKLREDVEIDHGTIWVSDLLPADAPKELRASAEKIELGRAPEPGCIRVLEGAQIVAAGQDLRQDLVVPEHITIRRIGYPISYEAIWRAISGFLLQHSSGSGQVPEHPELSWSAIAARNEPVIEATGASWDFQQAAWQFSVRCVDHASCGKFLVRMSGTYLARASSQQDATQAAIADSLKTSSSHRKARLPLLTKSGKQASLIFAGDGFRITLPVICLQPGVLGQRIRVRDPVGKRVLTAEVVSAGTLRAVADMQ